MVGGIFIQAYGLARFYVLRIVESCDRQAFSLACLRCLLIVFRLGAFSPPCSICLLEVRSCFVCLLTWSYIVPYLSYNVIRMSYSFSNLSYNSYNVIGVRSCPYGICCPWVRGRWDLDCLGKFFRRCHRRGHPRLWVPT